MHSGSWVYFDLSTIMIKQDGNFAAYVYVDYCEERVQVWLHRTSRSWLDDFFRDIKLYKSFLL